MSCLRHRAEQHGARWGRLLVAMRGSVELHWSFLDFTVLGQNLKPMLVSFVDAGRVFDKVGQFSLNDWKVTGGLGLRIACNLATIISF